MYTPLDIRKLQDKIDEITNKTEVVESDEIAELELSVEEEAPVQEDPEEVTNSGREEDEETRAGRLDRDSVKIDMVKPAIEKMLSSYEADAKEWNDRYSELEKEVRAKGVTDPRQIEIDVFNMDDDIVSYVNIDDLEDKIDAIKRLMKQGDADGQDIVDLGYSGPSDTVAREEFMRELKTAIKQDYPEVYDKLFMYDLDESTGATEKVAQEGDAELDELKGMLGRSGVMGLSN